MNRRIVAAASLVAIVLGGCGTQVEPTASPSASPDASIAPTQQPSTSAPPSTSPVPSAPAAPVVTWGQASVPESRNASSTVQIVPGGDGLVAIGFDGGFGSLLWTSADGGRTWTDITPADFASVGIASVVEFDGRLVGVGRGNTIDIETEEAAVYLSDDGREWRKVTSGEQMVGQLIDVVATDDGLFAVGGVPGADAAGIWRSADGETWERIGGDFQQAFMWAIADGGPGLVAVGWRRNPDPDLAVWTSADGGETWELAPDPEGFAGFEATDVAALDGSLVMVGSAMDGSGGRIWRSTDGVEWELVVDGMDGYARTLAATTHGLVAVGGGEGMQGRAWITTDGADWTELGEPVEGAFLHSAFETDDGTLIASGGTQAGTLETGVQAFAALWVGTLE